MSVNLPLRFRVIAIVVTVALAFSALAWSGENHLQPSSRSVVDTIPSRPKVDRAAVKHRKRAEEGRVARELDLRMDEMDAVSEELSDVVPDGENLLMKEEDLSMNEDALDELKDMSIGEEDLEILKELNIDDDIWNELKSLKEEMDDLQETIEADRSKGVDDYKVRDNRVCEGYERGGACRSSSDEALRRVLEAVRMEIPRVRIEVERALEEYQKSQNCQDGQGRQWQ